MSPTPTTPLREIESRIAAEFPEATVSARRIPIPQDYNPDFPCTVEVYGYRHSDGTEIPYLEVNAATPEALGDLLGQAVAEARSACEGDPVSAAPVEPLMPCPEWCTSEHDPADEFDRWHYGPTFGAHVRVGCFDGQTAAVLDDCGADDVTAQELQELGAACLAAAAWLEANA